MDDTLEYNIGKTITQLINLGRYAFVVDAARYLTELSALCKAQQKQIKDLGVQHQAVSDLYNALRLSIDTIIAEKDKQIAELQGSKRQGLFGSKE